ncbi:MAG: hypothetical protein U0L20_07215 [Ruminococcus sp.]|nr:hypothetical protein [Ruminococcus sp.]
MKKLSAILVALLLVATTAVTAFAAGINANEQAVLDELGKTVTMSGTEMVMPESFVNQAESYFNTVDLTEAQSKTIVAAIGEGMDFLSNSKAANISKLTYAQKKELLAIGQKAADAIDATLSYDNAKRVLIIKTATGEITFSAFPELSAKGGSSTPSKPGSNADNNNVIKPTGAEANFAGFATVGTVAIVLVAGSALYLVKTKKERA